MYKVRITHLSCSIMYLILRSSWLMLVYLGPGGAAPSGEEEAEAQKVEECVSVGKLLSRDDGICYKPLSQGPCTEPHHWFQLNTEDPGYGECEEKRCLPNFPDEEKSICTTRTVPAEELPECEGKGKAYHFSDEGEPVCGCSPGWAKGPNEQCHLYYLQGFCELGSIMVPGHGANISGVEVPCWPGAECRAAAECEDDSSSPLLQSDLITCLATPRQTKICCPTTDRVQYYINMYKYLGTEAVCIENPCKVGEILWYDEECHQPYCLPLEEESASDCSGRLELHNRDHHGQADGCQDSSGQVVCAAHDNEPFSPTSGPKRSCRARYVWSKFKQRCVPIVSNY